MMTHTYMTPNVQQMGTLLPAFLLIDQLQAEAIYESLKTCGNNKIIFL